MDRMRVELGRWRLEELRREAARERALAALRLGGEGRPAVAAGRLLVRVGARLESIGPRRRAAAGFVPVPCGGCAD